MERAGLFLVLEGCDGVGKSTQVALLERWLAENGIAFTSSREPGGTRVGEAIRDVVLLRNEVSIPPATELFLLLAARAAYVRDVVAPALSRGDVVLSDRFDLSTLAYQGYGRGLPLGEVESANEIAVNGVTPDLYVVFDLPDEEMRARMRSDGAKDDRIESGGEAFLRKVADGYRALADQRTDVQRIDATGNPEVVQARLRSLLGERFPETFSRGEG